MTTWFVAAMSLQTSSSPSTGQSASSNGREIYRNGWLRCIPYLQTSDQLPKSHLENLFVSFCIHDEDGPWLEFYDNRHCSADHKPVARFSLKECLHISPRLVCQEEDCFEFAVTLKDKVLRLATESRELTLDWVATLTEKLRERGVFQPKENEYTTEPHKGIAPAPGVANDNAHGNHSNNGSNYSASGSGGSRVAHVVSAGGVSAPGGGVVPLPPAHPRRNMPLPPPPTEESDGRCFGGGNASNRSSAGCRYRPPSAAEMRTSLLSIVESSSRFLRQESVESDASSSSSLGSSGDREASLGPAPTLSGTPRDPTSRLPAPPTSPAHDQPIYEPIFPLADRLLDRHHLSRTESARVAPRQRAALQEDRSAKRHSYTGMAEFEDGINSNNDFVPENRHVLVQHQPGGEGPMGDGRLNRGECPRGQPVANPFRCAARVSAAERVMARDTLYSDPAGCNDNANSSAGFSIVNRPPPGSDTGAVAAEFEGPTSLPPVSAPIPPEVPARSRHSIAEPRPLSPRPPRAMLRREATQDNMRRKAATGDGLNASSNGPFRSNQQPLERVQVRNSTVVPGPSPLDTANSATHANAPQIAESLYAEISETTTGHVTLREGQILKLQEEMAHQAGILVKFAKRDLQGSLALVDVGGAVYIAGWNKPQMRTDLHIGDRLLNICGRRVICASEANKTIKSLVINQTVELTIQRVPYGKALAMRRGFDGENLGLIMENGTNEIHRVLDGGLVHRSGLPLMVPTALDGGMTLTTWWITEVNHRPINLFYKNSEIEPRLRAVGKDISLVVQPSDFIRALKKQLKSMWSYKSYIAY